MKTTIVCLFAFVAVCANVAVAGTFDAVELPSVLTVAPTAPAVVVTQAPTVVVPAANPAVIAVQQPTRNSCANGRCKLYSVDQQQNEFHRHRLFGGSVTRKGTRTVVRPAR
jgi:hypothetical protein